MRRFATLFMVICFAAGSAGCSSNKFTRDIRDAAVGGFADAVQAAAFFLAGQVLPPPADAG